MFTGIIEKTGTVKEVFSRDGNKTFWISSPLSSCLKTDQSLSHNGVCLTVEETREDMHRVTAIRETLLKSNLDNWEAGTLVNLEKCMLLHSRFDGHIVQGHVDCTAECTQARSNEGSHEFRFSFDPVYKNLVVEKGSICLNGISLTIFNISLNEFTVAIIPYTYENTNMNRIKKGHKANVEFDLIGKYINRIHSLK